MKKLIGFFSDGPPFDGGTIYYHGLGGSESAVYYMARELHFLGNDVKVICNCENPGFYEGVHYIHKRDFKYLALNTEFDVLVLSRFYNFLQVPFKSKLTILWNHDILDNRFGLLRYLPKIDILFNLSDFHVYDYVTKIPRLKSMIWQTRNGIDIEAVNQYVKGIKKNPSKMIYASRPERGLQILLESIWPRLLKIFPRLELYLCGYTVGAMDVPASIKNLYARIGRLIKETPRVFDLGSLSKSDYYTHLAESQLMLYPCDFPEISCIVALEAQACRTPIITTNDFALKETVGIKEWLISGLPAQSDYQDRFIEKVRELLTNPWLYEETARRGHEWVRSRYTWRSIGPEWDRFFDKYLQKIKSLGHKKPLYRSGDSEAKHLKENLDVLSKNAAHLARKIKGIRPTSEIQIVMAKNGLPVLKKHIALHSLVDPEKEARKWAHRIEASGAIENEKRIAVFGFGMGYHVKALLDLGCPYAIVIEPDPAVLRIALEWGDFSTWLERITLVLGNEEVPDITNLHLVPHQPTVRLHKDLYYLWKQRINSSSQEPETIADMREAFKDHKEIVEFLKAFYANETASIDKLVEKIPRDNGPIKDWQTMFFLMKEFKERSGWHWPN